MNLTPLKELEPTPDEIARVRRRAAQPQPARRARRRAPALAVAAMAAAFTAATAIPGAQNATTALRAAAAAAADQPAPTAFTGYRYVEMIDRRKSHWGLPDDECLRRHDEPRPARPGSSARELPNCPVTVRAEYEQEGRQEIWVDARWNGTRRDHGSRITAAGGDPELAAALKRDFGRKPSTDEYVYGEGAFVRAPLAELPTEPEALLRTLTAAYEDGRWRVGGSLPPEAGQASRRFELAWYTAHMLAESNATPALRSAAFGVLARMDGVVDLGRVKDSRGREGHGIEVHGEVGPAAEEAKPARLRVIFDPEEGEVLAWGQFTADDFVEWTLLRTAHVHERGERG